MKLAVVLLPCFLLFVNQALAKSKSKRSLIYSNGSKLQIVIGTGLPIPLERIAASVGWVMKYTMRVPKNASDYTDPLTIVSQAKKRSVSNDTDYYDIYRHFEKKILSFHSEGSDCLLRAICEVSRVPMAGSGLIGKIWKIFLTPSSTTDAPINEENKYHNAELIGRRSDVDCQHHFSNCQFDLANMFTVIS